MAWVIEKRRPSRSITRTVVSPLTCTRGIPPRATLPQRVSMSGGSPCGPPITDDGGGDLTATITRPPAIASETSKARKADALKFPPPYGSNAAIVAQAQFSGYLPSRSTAKPEVQMSVVTLPLILLAVCGSGDDIPPAAPSPSGLSGTQMFATTDFLPEGMLRIGLSGRADLPGEGGTAWSAPLSVCYGFAEGLEAAASIPVYLSDNAWGGAEPTGDLVLGAKLLYESVRGGTALALTGLLEIPSGAADRDGGSRLGAGLVTSTTYRLVRLSIAGEYYLAGGNDPFSARLRDGARLDFGLSSFLSWRIEATAVLTADTDGSLAAGAGLAYLPLERLVLHLSTFGDMADPEGFRAQAGAAVTLGAETLQGGV